jgi:hypothetical protein
VNADGQTSQIDIQLRLVSGRFSVTLACAATDDFIHSCIDHMIDLHQSLAVQASPMPWQAIEAPRGLGLLPQ